MVYKRVSAGCSNSSSSSTSSLKTKSRVGETSFVYQNTQDVLRLTPLLLSFGANIIRTVTKYNLSSKSTSKGFEVGK